MAKTGSTKPPKGTRDFLAEDLRRRHHVVDVIREVYTRYGFEPLETPSFERLDALLGKYGEEGDQLVFKVLNRGQQLVDGVREAGAALDRPGVVRTGRSGETAPEVETLLADLGLRYDLTVPLARVVAQYGSKLPGVYRRFQIQPVWRADNPGKGRFREFYQCDVDVVGTASKLAEVEVCAAVTECLKRLGFEDFWIRANHRQLLKSLVEHAGIDPALEGATIGGLDKLDKISEAGVRREWSSAGVPEDAQDRLFEWVRRDGGPSSLRDIFSKDSDGSRALDELSEILDLSEAGPASGRIRFDPTLARGLGYYTGAIFEIAVGDLAGSLGGGGRYDGLVGMFSGKDVPACGFSLGLERLLVVMEQRGMFPEQSAAPDVLVAFSELEARGQAWELAGRIRGRGRTVELHPEPAKPGWVRKTADERGFSFAVVTTGEPDPELWARAEPEVRNRRVAEPDLMERLAREDGAAS
jgi:histidyl-tRNA synthetase